MVGNLAPKVVLLGSKVLWRRCQLASSPGPIETPHVGGFRVHSEDDFRRRGNGHHHGVHRRGCVPILRARWSVSLHPQRLRAFRRDADRLVLPARRGP
jgi:hypothetical protein